MAIEKSGRIKRLKKMGPWAIRALVSGAHKEVLNSIWPSILHPEEKPMNSSDGKINRREFLILERGCRGRESLHEQSGIVLFTHRRPTPDLAGAHRIGNRVAC